MGVHAPSRELHPEPPRARAAASNARLRERAAYLIFLYLVTFTISTYFHAAELPAKKALGSDGYRTGDTDAFLFPVAVGGSGDRFARSPGTCSAASLVGADGLTAVSPRLTMTGCLLSGFDGIPRRGQRSRERASRTTAIAVAALVRASVGRSATCARLSLPPLGPEPRRLSLGLSLESRRRLRL